MRDATVAVALCVQPRRCSKGSGTAARAIRACLNAACVQGVAITVAYRSLIRLPTAVDANERALVRGAENSRLKLVCALNTDRFVSRVFHILESHLRAKRVVSFRSVWLSARSLACVAARNVVSLLGPHVLAAAGTGHLFRVVMEA